MKRTLSDDKVTSPQKVLKVSSIPQMKTIYDALEYLSSLYPPMNSKNLGRPIVLKSQLYALLNNRNKVESQLSDMQKSQKIRLLYIDDEIDDSIGVMKSDDFVNSFRDFSIDESTLLERFAEFTSQKYHHLSLCKRITSENFSDNEISILVQNGALTIKSENSWYISTPYLGNFIRAYKAGQRGLLTLIKRTRFKELLLSEIFHRNLGKGAYLGHMYHLLAHLGAGTFNSSPLVLV
uniref:Serine/threonine-protein kinase 19 n=1 Tax=Schistosoma japonicum TaxID=6182 RepID=Q5DGF6_SCHJA|nr:unknown [Schistosoma japonicum]